MKKISILEIMQGFHNVLDVNFYNKENIANIDGKDADEIAKKKEEIISKSFLVVEDKIAYTFTPSGENLADIFATIDAANKLDMKRHYRVLDEYPVSDYPILKPLKDFVRPAKAIVTGNQSGSIPMKDILEAYQPYLDEGKGNVLSPGQFERAQLKLLRTINKKCVSLSDTEKVDRTSITLTENDYQVYPVRVNGELVAVSKSESIKLFPINLKVYDDDDYILDYTHEYVIDRMEQIGVEILKVTNNRGGNATN